jgi:hypothetical protein
MSDVSLEASYGALSWLAFDVRVPYRIVDITPTYTEIDGSPKQVPDDIHHHDRTITGLGDPWLLLRLGARKDALDASSRLGVSLPLGMTQPDPFELGQRGQWHEHTQLGTGIVMPIVSLAVSYRLEPWTIGGSLFGLFGLYENQHGWRPSSRLGVGSRLSLSLAGGKLTPFATLDLAHQTEEAWHGERGLEGSTIRSELLLGGGLGWRFADPWTLELGLRARAATLSEESGFDYPGSADLSLSTRFDLAPGTGSE